MSGELKWNSVKLVDGLRQQLAAAEEREQQLHKEVGHQKANWEEMHRDCMKAEERERDREGSHEHDRELWKAAMAELEAENRRLREALVSIASDDQAELHTASRVLREIAREALSQPKEGK